MTKLTPELQKKFLDLLSDGVPRKDAFIACDITERIYYIWMRKGKDHHDKGIDDKFVQFFQEATRSRSERLAWICKQLKTMANKGNLNALMIQAHKEFPEEFPREPTELNISLKPTVQQLNEFYELKEKEKLKEKKQPLLEEKKE